MSGNLKSIIRAVSYEHKLISSGNNFSNLDMSKESLDLICILLHKRKELRDIQGILGISETQLATRLEKLMHEGLLKKEKERYLPKFMVLLREDEEWFRKLSTSIGNEIFRLIIRSRDQIIRETLNIKVFKNYSFNELSLFILSDVIMAFIQIDNVEKLFLKTHRPCRNNKNYYYAIMENMKNSTTEAFGIYGNHCEQIGDFYFCIYGNERYSNRNLVTLTEKQGIKLFGHQYVDMKDFKNYVLEEIIRSYKLGVPLKEYIQSGLKELDIISSDGTIKVPLLDTADYQSLFVIADVIKNDLIEILNTNKCYLVNEFNNSRYKEETSFEEFFVWYYHILYSHVTELLIESNVIDKPTGGVFQYILYS